MPAPRENDTETRSIGWAGHLIWINWSHPKRMNPPFGSRPFCLVRVSFLWTPAGLRRAQQWASHRHRPAGDHASIWFHSPERHRPRTRAQRRARIDADAGRGAKPHGAQASRSQAKGRGFTYLGICITPAGGESIHQVGSSPCSLRVSACEAMIDAAIWLLASPRPRLGTGRQAGAR